MVACSQIRATRAFLSPVTGRPTSVRITLRSATVYCRSTSSALEKSGKGGGVSASAAMSSLGHERRALGRLAHSGRSRRHLQQWMVVPSSDTVPWRWHRKHRA
eukprot:2887348-Rhodomonas_salina.1